jgi:hypothetical protein
VAAGLIRAQGNVVLVPQEFWIDIEIKIGIEIGKLLEIVFNTILISMGVAPP